MRLLRPVSHKVGLAPGTLVPMTESVTKPRGTISLVDYSPDVFYPEQVIDNSQIPEQPYDCQRLVIVKGVHDVDMIEKTGKIFNLHALILEDIANTGHPVKMEEWDDGAFIIMKTMFFKDESDRVAFNQVSLFVGHQQVILFHEGNREFLDPVMKRLEGSKGRIRKSGSGYLAYAIIDSIVDHYFIVLEAMNQEIEQMEDEVFKTTDRDLIQRIYHLKRQTMVIRRTIRPLHDILNSLVREDSVFFPNTINIFLQDVQDHTLLVVETLDAFRDLLSGCLDSAMTADGNRMNEVMKVLTIIATIFIPLTFIAGIYGMNFEVMPELKWQWGYPTVLLGMLVILVGMVVWFRKKKWL